MKRLLIVARHVWPCTDDASLRLRHMAEQLKNEHWHSTFVTPRWHSSWPSKLTLSGSIIHRVDSPPSTPLRQLKYLQNLKNWARQHIADFDAVYCDEPNADAEVTMSCLTGNHAPAVLRLELGNSDCEPSDELLRACAKATTILVPNRLSHQRAISLGLPPNRLQRIALLWHSVVDRNESSRREARKMLSDVNGDLHLASHERVIVVPGDTWNSWPIEFLIRSIARFIEEHPGLRVWILGSVQKNERLSDLLKEYCIYRDVVLPGVFVSIEPVLQAADLCLFPGPGCGQSYLIPSCLFSGIPILAARHAELETSLGAYSRILSFETDSASDVLEKVSQWWESPESFVQAARSVQRLLHRENAANFVTGKLEEFLRLRSYSNPDANLEPFHDRLRPA